CSTRSGISREIDTRDEFVVFRDGGTAPGGHAVMDALLHFTHSQRMKRLATSPMDELPGMDELPLVCRAQRGDTLAFDELTRRVRAKLVHWLRQRTGCWADAEDIAQQALFRAFKYIHQHDQQRPFSVWLYKIARRVAIDHAQ